jgi:predicted cupin superfamily sugar epimerase
MGCTVGPGFEFADFQLLADTLAPDALMRDYPPAVTMFW